MLLNCMTCYCYRFVCPWVLIEQGLVEHQVRRRHELEERQHGGRHVAELRLQEYLPCGDSTNHKLTNYNFRRTKTLNA